METSPTSVLTGLCSCVRSSSDHAGRKERPARGQPVSPSSSQDPGEHHHVRAFWRIRKSEKSCSSVVGGSHMSSTVTLRMASPLSCPGGQHQLGALERAACGWPRSSVPRGQGSGGARVLPAASGAWGMDEEAHVEAFHPVRLIQMVGVGEGGHRWCAVPSLTHPHRTRALPTLLRTPLLRGARRPARPSRSVRPPGDGEHGVHSPRGQLLPADPFEAVGAG